MWASSRPCPPPPPIIISKTSSRPVSHFPVSVSVTFHRQHRRAPPLQSSKSSSSSSSAEEIGGLGHAVLTALKSNIIDSKTPITNTPIPKPKQLQQEKQEKQKQQEGEERQQLSGSDVLWALTKAAAQNKKKKANVVVGGGKKMKKGLNYGVDDSSSSNRDGVYEEDYSNVRSLNIKSDWVTRLDDLEKRLKELSEI